MQNCHNGRLCSKHTAYLKFLEVQLISSYMSCKLKHQFDHDPKVNFSQRVMYMELENVYETKHSRFAN